MLFLIQITSETILCLKKRRVWFERLNVDKKANLSQKLKIKLHSRVFLIFLPNVTRIDPHNFELYCFKVDAFFETQCTIHREWGALHGTPNCNWKRQFTMLRKTTEVYYVNKWTNAIYYTNSAVFCAIQCCNVAGGQHKRRLTCENWDVLLQLFTLFILF